MSIHSGEELTPRTRYGSQAVFRGRSGKQPLVNGGEWRVANHGPLSLSPSCLVRHCLDGRLANYLPKPTSVKLVQDETSPLTFLHSLHAPPPRFTVYFMEQRATVI